MKFSLTLLTSDFPLSLSVSIAYLYYNKWQHLKIVTAPCLLHSPTKKQAFCAQAFYVVDSQDTGWINDLALKSIGWFFNTETGN